MKAKILTIILCTLIVSLCSCADSKSTKVTTKVLTVNSEILEGKLIGHFLSSADGWIKSDIIKVGVSFELHGYLFLEDLKLSHAQLAYYKDKIELPLLLEVQKRWCNNSGVEIRLNGYYMKRRKIS